jgi:hypothetical protein
VIDGYLPGTVVPMTEQRDPQEAAQQPEQPDQQSEQQSEPTQGGSTGDINADTTLGRTGDDDDVTPDEPERERDED